MRKLVLIVFIFNIYIIGQTGSIKGHIKDAQSGKSLRDVLVQIESKKISATSNKKGNFVLKNVPPGKYMLLFMKEGYYSLVVPDVTVKAGKRTAIKSIGLYTGDENEVLYLEIGGIQVTAERELMPLEAETVHKINSGEIEHMQANSLSDVLELLPGNERSTNFGLQSKQQINLRTIGDGSAEDKLAAFGTKVIIDDVPLSNNANMQTGIGVGYGTKVQKSAEGEYDLREIAAENLEKVEVQAGASSVEYGDNTSGVVVVKTKLQNLPTRLKLKNNPDTREMNLMGSFKMFNTVFSYNFNYGYSERNIRVEGDEYHRINGVLSWKNNLNGEELTLSQKISYSRIFEEDNDPSDANRVRAYNRDHHFTYSQRYNWIINSTSNSYLRLFVDYRRRNSWLSRLEVTDLGYRTNLTEPGTIEGILTDPVYISDVTTIGNEWSYGLKFKYEKKVLWGDILHRILTGGEFQKDENNGPGKQFDLLYPPRGKSIRPRPFDDLPAITQLSFFLEDRITGEVVFPFTFNFGFRLDNYNPKGFDPGALFEDGDIFKSAQGTFFNPRLGLKLKLTPSTQLRMTYGKSSKAPALSMIYPDPFYLDVYDYTYRTENINGRDSTYKVQLISTYLYNNASPYLKGYQSTKYEIGFDQQIGDVAFSISGFYQNMNKMPKNENIPFIYHIYYWKDWPQNTNKEVVETIMKSTSLYSKKVNVGWSINRGIEFSLRTHRIKALNMRFYVTGSFIDRHTGADFYPVFAVSDKEYIKGDTLSSGWIVPDSMRIIPYYAPEETKKQKFIINYKVDYIAKPLGIWLTFSAQQVVWERGIRRSNNDPHAKGYYTEEGGIVTITPEQSTLMELDRTYNSDDVISLEKPVKWLFSVVVSKSLFKGAELSLYVNNIFNDRAYYINTIGAYVARNPDLFWGIAFSSKLDEVFK